MKSVRYATTTLKAWVDSSSPDHFDQMKPDRLTAKDCFRCIPFFGMHIACLGVIWTGWSWIALSTAIASYFVRMFAITGFYHRYFSHRAFETNRFWQFVFAFIGSCSVQRGPLWWAAHHRRHHRHAGTGEDPHSHRRSFLWCHVGWFMSGRNFSTRRHLVRDWGRFPELVWLDRFDIAAPTLFALSLYLLGEVLGHFWPAWGTDGWQLVTWGFCISTVILYHATFTINSLAHAWGSQRFRADDDSRNNFLLALITLGEGWHNNHHRAPNAARQGFLWWEVDITYYVLLMLARLGIVSDLKPVPAALHLEARRGDRS